MNATNINTQVYSTAAVDNKKLSNKIFIRLIPLMIIIYVISFLDRTNIGMAKDSMSISLGLSATAFGIGAGLFFLTYAIFEIPSNLIMEKVGARLWIARIMITWGIVSCAMAWCSGPISFYVLRLLLGISEAGLYPGMILYLTYWFTKEERAKAIGLFLLGVCLANVIGGPIGGMLLSLDGLGGFHGWQWLFVVEGIPAILLSVVVLFYLPNKPADAKFLTDDEKKALEIKLQKDKELIKVVDSKFSLFNVIFNPIFLILLLVYFTHQFSVYGLSYFLPTIIGNFGNLTPIEIGLITAIPWICSSIGAIFIPQYANTAAKSRMILIFGYACMSVGLVIGALGTPVIAVIGFCLTAFMFFAVQSVIFSYLPMYMTGSKLAGAIATLNCLGLLGGFLGPFILGFFEDLTNSPRAGLWFGVFLVVVAFIVCLTVSIDKMIEKRR